MSFGNNYCWSTHLKKIRIVVWPDWRRLKTVENRRQWGYYKNDVIMWTEWGVADGNDHNVEEDLAKVTFTRVIRLQKYYLKYCTSTLHRAAAAQCIAKPCTVLLYFTFYEPSQLYWIISSAMRKRFSSYPSKWIW